MKPKVKDTEKLRRLSLVTILAVYFLILVGGIVRSTGSGMGCPDWPKCFGQWIPPTSSEQLPENYKELYAGKRAQKNQKIAGYLKSLGFRELAERIEQDKNSLKEPAFNRVKTWIEYVNRLIGVVIGFLILGVFARSIEFLKSDKTIFLISLSALLLVVFQAWVGSIVVSTNLLPGVVTFHMITALVIVALLLFIYHRTSSKFHDIKITRKLLINTLLWVNLVGLTVQIALGTQVREAIDQIAVMFDYAMRDQWISGLGITFVIHRSYSLLILALNMALAFAVFRFVVGSKIIEGLVLALVMMVLLEVVLGVSLAYLALPPLVQPLHLVIAALLFGVQFLLLLSLNRPRLTETTA